MNKGGDTIIICEDDAGILEVISLVLKGEGFKTILHTTLEGLEEKIIVEKPKILLLDLWLNGANGEEMLQRLVLNDRFKETNIILMSAHSSLVDIAKEHGVSYLLKPFALDELQKVIKRNS